MIFLDILSKFAPIYIYILVGIFLTRFHKIKADSIVTILVYFLAPVVTFNGISKMDLNISNLSLPFILFVLSLFFVLIGRIVFARFFSRSELNLYLASSGMTNFGFFAIPVGILLFEPELEGLIILAGVGFQLFQDTVGYYFINRTNFSVTQSLISIIKLPNIQFLILALAVNLLSLNGFHDNELYQSLINNIRGAFVVLGIVVIGMGVGASQIKSFKLSKLTLFLVTKFIFWPIVVTLLIFLDNQYWQFLNANQESVLRLMSLLPFGSFLYVYSKKSEMESELAAQLVFVSALIAGLVIPLYALWIGL